MGKILKWLAIVFGVLVGLIVIAVIAVWGISTFRISKTYHITPEVVAIPTDAASVALGRHILETRGCPDCHGANLAGKTFIDDPMIGHIYGTNITSGKSARAGQLTDADWVRAIRHGVGPSGKGLLIMPSKEFYYLSDQDLGDLIAYLKTVPPVDNTPPKSSVGPLGRLLFVMGQIDALAVEGINHTGPRPVAPPPEVTVAYGKYLAVGCKGCHGEGYSGGKIPGTPPDWPPAANITPSGNLAHWSEAAFLTTLRTGTTPEGKQMNSDYMPWKNISKMSDDELKAIWMFLQTLPAKETGTR